MRAGRAQPLGFVEPDDPRLHHDAAVAPGGEPVAARKLPACDIAPRDAAAGKGAGDAACSARQGARLKHPLKIGARFPATGIARLAKPRCEIVLVAHRSGSRDAEMVVECEGCARSPAKINDTRSLAWETTRLDAPCPSNTATDLANKT